MRRWDIARRWRVRRRIKWGGCKWGSWTTHRWGSGTIERKPNHTPGGFGIFLLWLLFSNDKKLSLSSPFDSSHITLVRSSLWFLLLVRSWKHRSLLCTVHLFLPFFLPFLGIIILFLLSWGSSFSQNFPSLSTKPNGTKRSDRRRGQNLLFNVTKHVIGVSNVVHKQTFTTVSIFDCTGSFQHNTATFSESRKVRGNLCLDVFGKMLLFLFQSQSLLLH
mmetsp:Transcript_35653/g.55658  ORF Transcript_35653/g.55658 Transcript_35653/m.55658 type:complete len:219 (+) Transcript_35653:218-874(+)